MRFIKYIFVFFVLLFFCVNVGLFYNDQEGINKIDEKGKQGKWIYFGKDCFELGIFVIGKVEEGNYWDDCKEGIWIKYYNDGVIFKLRGEYVNNCLWGNYIKYYLNGKVKEIGNFEKNQYYDFLKCFNENGKFEYEVNYNDFGKEQGMVKYYYLNG